MPTNATSSRSRSQVICEKFGELSVAIDTYMTGLKLKAPDGVKVAFCPMVQKPWLQTASTVDNPYFGKSMLTCGSFR